MYNYPHGAFVFTWQIAQYNLQWGRWANIISLRWQGWMAVPKYSTLSMAWSDVGSLRLQFGTRLP